MTSRTPWEQNGRVMRSVLFVTIVVAALTFTVGATPADTVVLKARLTGKWLGTTSKGTGTATITFKGAKVCWKLSYQGLDTPGDSGIRLLPPPPDPSKHKRSVFPLTATTSTAPGCVPSNKWGPSSAGWAAKIAAEPTRFYVSIATKKYPQGAIAGPLKRG